MSIINRFIHPKLNNPKHEDYRKAIIFVYASFVTFTFLVLYNIYFFMFHAGDTVKITTNIVGTLVFLLGVLNFRLRDNLKQSLGFFMLLCSPFALISIYHTGGIYSADIIWVMLILVSAYLFIGVTIGNLLSLIVVLYLIGLYILDLSGHKDFKNYIIANNSTHNIFTYLFVIALLAVLLISFNNVLQKTNNRLQALKQEKIEELEGKVREKTKELILLRKELAKDFHDEMGNKLASITILSQTIGLKMDRGENKENLKELLNSIEERSKQLYHGTKDFIWSIDFKSDYVDEWFIYIRDFGEDFFGKLGISFYSEFSLESKNLMFTTTVGRQLIYIIKEAMTNAAKHSGASQVNLKLINANNFVDIEFFDNGYGFDIKNTTCRGLNHIQERIEKINGTVIIYSADGIGTKIVLLIPLSTRSFT